MCGLDVHHRRSYSPAEAELVELMDKARVLSLNAHDGNRGSFLLYAQEPPQKIENDNPYITLTRKNMLIFFFLGGVFMQIVA